MKIMGLDLGKARIGVAMCDELEILATGYETIYCKSLTKDVLSVANIVKKFSIKKIVVGLPLQMNGSGGTMTDYVHLFCEKLKEIVDVEIVFQDERLTSVEAEGYLHSAGTKKNRKKQVLDQIAASIILQSYLDEKRR